MTKPDIKQTQFQCLLPLKEATQAELLGRLVSNEITLKEMKQRVAKRRVCVTLRTGFAPYKLKKKKKKWEEAEERLPQHATDLVLLL